MDILTNKTYKSFDFLSRYPVFPYYYNTEDNKYIYGLTNHLNKDVPYVVHTVDKGESLDSISLYYYNNPTYYWVICDFNNIQDPFNDLTVGDKLLIPSFSSISFE